MRAQYIYKKAVHEIQVSKPAPPTLTVTTRGCAKNPPVELDLALVHESDITAFYRVVAERVKEA